MRNAALFLIHFGKVCKKAESLFLSSSNCIWRPATRWPTKMTRLAKWFILNQPTSWMRNKPSCATRSSPSRFICRRPLHGHRRHPTRINCAWFASTSRSPALCSHVDIRASAPHASANWTAVRCVAGRLLVISASAVKSTWIAPVLGKQEQEMRIRCPRANHLARLLWLQLQLQFLLKQVISHTWNGSMTGTTGSPISSASHDEPSATVTPPLLANLL